MRFTLPEANLEQNQQTETESNEYYGLSKDIIDNETIPLPPGLSRVRTIRKMHLEMDTVRKQLKEWDLLQERLLSTLNVLGITAQKLTESEHSLLMVKKLQQDCCYLKNEIQTLQGSSDALDPRFSQLDMFEDGYISIPDKALHYLAVYDDNPWEH